MGECFYWYRPTQVVPDQRLLNRCVCVCVAGMQLAENFTRTHVFAELGARPTGRHHPHCTSAAAADDQPESYLDCFVRQNTMSAYHLAGTCRMGAAGDHGAVVDPQLR